MDHSFGSRIGVHCLQHAPAVRAIVAASSAAFWGVWDDQSLRKILCVREKSVVNALSVVAYSRDAEDLKHMGEMTFNPTQKQIRDKENFLTVAVASAGGVNVYTIDTHDVCGVQSYQLLYARDLYVTDLAVVRLPINEKRGTAYIAGRYAPALPHLALSLNQRSPLPGSLPHPPMNAHAA